MHERIIHHISCPHAVLSTLRAHQREGKIVVTDLVSNVACVLVSCAFNVATEANSGLAFM